MQARVDGNFEPVVPYPGDFWHFARVQVLAAARAGMVDAIDAPYPAYQDPDGYRRSALQASALGYDGKWAIHPSQVPIATRGLLADARGGGRGPGGHGRLPRGRGRRGRRHRT